MFLQTAVIQATALPSASKSSLLKASLCQLYLLIEIGERLWRG